MPGRQGNRGSHLLEEGGGGGRLVPSSQPLVQPHRPGCLGLGGWGGWFQPPLIVPHHRFTQGTRAPHVEAASG